MEKYYDFLQKHKLFAHLTSDQLHLIHSLLTVLTFELNEDIVHEGDKPHDLFVIYDGEVQIFKLEEKTQQFYPIATLESGAVLGEMSLLDENIPRGATIRATRTTNVLRIPFKTLHDLENSDDLERKLIYYRIIENIACELCSRLRNANEIIASSVRSQEEEQQVSSAQGNFFASLFRF